MLPKESEVEGEFETTEKGGKTFKNIKTIKLLCAEPSVKLISPEKPAEQKPQPKFDFTKEISMWDVVDEVLITLNESFHFGSLEQLPLPEKIEIMKATVTLAEPIYRFRNWNLQELKQK